jgi:hypothetical protein
LIEVNHPALAAPGGSAYLEPMAQSLPSEQEIVAIPPSSSGIRLVVAWGAAGVAAAAVTGALALWFHYGTAVFFETIAAGISSCF